jgi:methylated-DNA-protein-cysteine methyltransferase-like protein
MLALMATEFSTQVIQLVRAIPKGKVATYGQIAQLAGKPQGSRGVAWLLSSSSNAHKLPWHRVLNSKGKISFPPGSASHKKQKRLLQGEGVVFSADQIDLRKFGWKRKPRLIQNPRQPRMFS